MEKNLSKKNIVRKVLTQGKMDLNCYIDNSINIKESNAKDESMSHISTDYRKGKVKQKKLFIINSTIQEKRKEIYKSSSLKNEIMKCYKLILKNQKKLIYLINDNKIGYP